MKDFFNTKVIKNTRFYWIYIAALGITFIFWWILAIRIPLMYYIPHWFWHVTRESWSAWWLFFPFLVLSIVVIFVLRRISHGIAGILILIATGMIAQHIFGLMEGRGIDGIRDNTIISGHATFAIESLRMPSFFVIASSYDDLLRNKFLQQYPNATKPPGQLLFYMLNERAARFLPGVWDSPLQRLATFIALLWPILASLPVIFIYLLARICEKDETYMIASLLYIFTPAVILIPLHLDQCLYPLLFVFTLVLFIFGVKKNSLLLFFISGVATGLAMFISFSLIAIPFYILLILIIKIGAEILSKGQPLLHESAQIIRENIKIGFVYALGLFFLEAFLFLNYSYNVFASYQLVMSIHTISKILIWSPQTIIAAGGWNILEYSLWTGVPLFVLMAAYGVRAFKKIWTGNFDLFLVMGAAAPLLFLALTLFGRTAGETARLWIFLTPLVVIFSAKEIIHRFQERTWNTVIFLILLQLITTFSLKMWQDF